MKKKLFKRISILLVLVLSLVMISACSKDTNQEDEKSSDQSSEQTAGQSSEQPTEEKEEPTPIVKVDKTQLAKEGVYRCQDFTDEISNDMSYSVLTAGKTDDGFAFIATTDSYYEYKGFYCSAKNDGSDFQVTKLDFKPFLNEKDTDYVAYAAREYATLTDKYVFVACDFIRNVNRGGEYQGQEREFCVGCFDKSGAFLWRAKIGELSKEDAENYWINCLCGMNDGGAALLLGGYYGGVIRVDNKGNASDFIDAPGDYLKSYPRCVPRADGTVLLCCGDGWTGQSLVSYDPAKNEFGSEQKILINRGYIVSDLTFGEGENLIFVEDEGIFSFRPQDTEVKKVMDFVNSDLYIYGIENVLWIDDSHLFGSTTDEEGVHPCLFTYVKPETIPDKKILVMGAVYFDWADKRNVVKFNKSNDEYRIVLRNYNMINREYGEYYKAMDEDLLSENAADIVMLQYDAPRVKYENMGLLANLDELIKNDAELGKLEYAENIFDAFRNNGKLYCLIPRFYFYTYVGKKSLWGDGEGITFDEAEQMADKVKASSLFGKNHVSDWYSFMQIAMGYCGNDFVDFSNRKCNFDVKQFRDILEYAKRISESEQEDDWGYYYDSMEFRENKALLLEVSAYWLMGFARMTRGELGEEVAYLGFPTENGSGAILDFEKAYVILDKSENKEGAWEFLRVFLSEEYQEDDNSGNGSPVLKKALKRIVDEQMERPYWVDENGRKEYYDMIDYYGDETGTINPLSQQEAEELWKCIENIRKARFSNSSVAAIVYEESAGYVCGTESMKSVIERIQERTQQYLDEN